MCFETDSNKNKRRQEMLTLVSEYLKTNQLDTVKDYLASLKNDGVINWCGCDGVFEARTQYGIPVIYVEVLGRIEKFVFAESPYVEDSSFSEAIPNYKDYLGVEDYFGI